MADKFDKPSKVPASQNGPKKAAPASGSRLEQAQKRAQAMASGGRKPVSAATFFQEAWVELKKTTWPDKDTTTKSTIVVLGLVLATAVYVGGLDFILSKIMNPLFQGH
jgi:preprotein translocase subunit SecE